ncbi:MAG: VOC family protein [Brasilonema angustatum HA4187-MV1]|jgi:predicted enzyme related to lactoylglutathione lyase|nr:VOC family protein [Brasilonema angustatum HA4187-MV1]
MNVIQGLTKALVYVTDIDKQIDFYQNKLGLTIKCRQSIEGRIDKQWVEFITGECTLVLHGNMHKQIGTDKPTLLAFHVDDIDVAYKELTERGVKLSAIRSPSPGLKIAEGVDPEGNPFSIDCQK